MRNIIDIWVDYYPCYDKVWSIVEYEFLIWTNIYFKLTSELIAPHLIDVMSWALRYEYVCLIMIMIIIIIMNLWYASQNTHANRVVLVFVHIVSEPSWSGESPTCEDWSSHSTKPHAHCILIF